MECLVETFKVPLKPKVLSMHHIYSPGVLLAQGVPVPAVAAGVEDIHTDNEDLLVMNLLPVSAAWTCHLCDHLPSYLGTILDLVHQPPTNAYVIDVVVHQPI